MDSRALQESGTSASIGGDQTHLLQEILSKLQVLQESHRSLAASVALIEGRVNVSSETRHVHSTDRSAAHGYDGKQQTSPTRMVNQLHGSPVLLPFAELASSPKTAPVEGSASLATQNGLTTPTTQPAAPTKIILSTYPNQPGISPCKMNWGHPDPQQRGPVVCNRSSPSTIRRRNGKCAIGYSV